MPVRAYSPTIGLQPPRMFSLQSFVNRIGRSNRENGHLVSESTHRSCGLAPRQLRCQCLPMLDRCWVVVGMIAIALNTFWDTTQAKNAIGN